MGIRFTKRILSALTFILLTSACLNSAFASSCHYVVDKATRDAGVQNLSELLSLNENGTAQDQTVFYGGQTSNNQMILTKPKGLLWNSRFDPLPQGFTIHGSPLRPVYYYGAKLSYAMGYDIIRHPEGSMSLLVPNANRLAHFVQKVNPILASKGKETITYLPIRMGYVSDRKVVELTAQENKNGMVFFPYSDKDPQLASHEAGFHLIALVYPKFVTDRAKRISQRHLQMVEMIQTSTELSKEAKDRLVDLLIKHRAFELDYGFANTGVIVADKIQEGLSLKVPKKIIYSSAALPVALDYLIRPALTPSMAVIARVLRVLSLDKIGNVLVGREYNLFSSYNETPMKISEQELAVVIQIVQSFSARYYAEDANEFKLMDSYKALELMLISVEQKMQDILDATEVL